MTVGKWQWENDSGKMTGPYPWNFPLILLWEKPFCVVLGVWDVVDPGSDDAKKNNIVKGLLFQSILEDLILQIRNLKTGKEMWEAIKTHNLGVDHVKEARLQTLIMEFENLNMSDNDSIDAYAAKLSVIASKSATLREVMSEHKLIIPIGIVTQAEGEDVVCGRGRGQGRGQGNSQNQGCDIYIRGDFLTMCDSCGSLLIKVSQSANRLYKAQLKVGKTYCLQANIDEESWLWHVRLGHISFGAANLMHKLAKRVPVVRVMIELRVDVELKDNIVLAMPKITREGHYTCNVHVEYDGKTPRCSSCKYTTNSSGNKKKGAKPTIKVSNSNLFDVLNSVDNDVEFGTNGGTTNLVNNVATLSRSSFMTVDNSSSGTTHIIEKIRKFEDLLTSRQAILVDKARNPLKKVEFLGEYDSKDEVAPVDNDMARSMAYERVGFGTQSLLEQWRDLYGNGDYDDDPYDDDMYEGQDLSHELRDICDNLDICNPELATVYSPVHLFESPVYMANSEGEEDAYESDDMPILERRSTHNKVLPMRLVDYQLNVHELMLTLDDKPRNYNEAKLKLQWLKPMKIKLDSVVKNNTWKLVSLPIGVILIGLKWLFKIKRNADGSVMKYKARLVAKGYV
ncbi:RNA-directed DNA polymerase, eukaryota, reverse transcriptase zinc-binding domain protein [Tanacetum coccineum]